MQYAGTLMLSMVLALVLTPVVRRFAVRIGAVDRADGFRKLHEKPVPLCGGLAVFAAFVLAVLAASVVPGLETVLLCLRSGRFIPFASMALLILLMGLFDDIAGIKAGWKFLVQLLVAIAMFYSGYRIGAVSMPFAGPLELGWFAGPLTVFWFLGCMNAINLVDGLDGLAAGVSLFAVGAIFITSVVFGNTAGAVFSAALAGALLGFLPYNFHPASIFLGDSGSYLLGFTIAAISIQATQKSRVAFALLVPIIALGVPIIDTALAIVRRWARSLPISAADREHLHHRLRDMGLSHRKAVLLIYCVCLFLAVVSLLMVADRDFHAASILLVFGITAGVMIRVYGVEEWRLLLSRAVNSRRRKKRRTRNRCTVHVAAQKMRQARSLEELWEIFSDAAVRIQLRNASLILEGAWAENAGMGAVSELCWSDPHSCSVSPECVTWTASYPLFCNGAMEGELQVCKVSENVLLDSDLPGLVQELVRAMAESLETINSKTASVRPRAQRIEAVHAPE